MEENQGTLETIAELRSKIIHCRTMTPNAKGLAGMIFFKVENHISLDSLETKFYEDLHLFLNAPTTKQREIG